MGDENNTDSGVLDDEAIRARLKVHKVLDDPAKCEYKDPKPGEKVVVPLHSEDDERVTFLFGLYEGARNSSILLDVYTDRKLTMHTRHESVMLARVDLGDNIKHTNPDGKVIYGPHIHVATGKYGIRMAYPLERQDILFIEGDFADPCDVFDAFKRYCNIDESLTINWSLGV